MRFLSAEEWAEIKSLYEKGVPLKVLGNQFYVEANTIKVRANRQKWDKSKRGDRNLQQVTFNEQTDAQLAEILEAVNVDADPSDPEGKAVLVEATNRAEYLYADRMLAMITQKPPRTALDAQIYRSRVQTAKELFDMKRRVLGMDKQEITVTGSIGVGLVAPQQYGTAAEWEAQTIRTIEGKAEPAEVEDGGDLSFLE